MQIYHNQTFEYVSFDDMNSNTLLQDREFKKCHFEGCTLSLALHPSHRTKVRNVKLLDCSERSCSLGAAMVEDVFVDGLNTNGQLFQTWGAVFRRVTLKGKIGRVMISSTVLPGVATSDHQQAFDEVNTEYYRSNEWALDISQGEFRELSIRGIPGHLIRRDPETQLLITRPKALAGSWKDLPFRENLWWVTIDLFLQREESSVVLVAPKRHPKFQLYLNDLKLLRNAGIAEQD